MKVQRIQLPDSRGISWLVLDDTYLPIPPVLVYLKFLNNVGRSPNTIRTTAYHLKLFWEYLRDEQLAWTQMSVQQLAAFIAWLRLPLSDVLASESYQAHRTDATIDQILAAVHGFYDFHIRMKIVPDLGLYRFLSVPTRRYKPFLHGMVKSRPQRSRVVQVKREERLIKTLTRQQIQELINACPHLRDKFLLTLLSETGMRIGQALGLRHEDLKPEENEIHIVPRDDNANGARAKVQTPYTVPLQDTLVMQRYVEYVVRELDGLEAGQLPDYVFINLWEGQVGRPMSYDTVMSLFRRLREKTGIYVTPHMLRHTRATQWIRDDHLPLATVSRLLGHASIQTTHDIYVHLTAEDLRKDLQQRRQGGSE